MRAALAAAAQLIGGVGDCAARLIALRYCSGRSRGLARSRRAGPVSGPAADWSARLSQLSRSLPRLRRLPCGGARDRTGALRLITMARLNGVELLAWLTDVLERVVSGLTKGHEQHTKLPRNWQAATISTAAA